MSASVVGFPVVDRRQPWLGLASYRETDSELFFGREHESLELLRLVRREVLTVLFGPSGTGKTSLLNAGLFPHLRTSGFFPVSIRLDHLGERPDYVGQIRSLIAGALHADRESPIEEEALAPPQAPEQRETLWEYLQRTVFWDRRNNPVTPVLVFDQFEELFTIGRNPAAREEFLSALADVVENYIPAVVRARLDAHGEAIPFPHDQPKAKVVLSLREDFVSRLDGLRKAMPSVMHNRFTIARMNGEQALSAVQEPGREIVDAPVAAQIVRFVAGANQSRSVAGESELQFASVQVDPALLSVVCRELNARRIEQEKASITGDLVTQAGTNILTDFYERSFAGLNPAVRVFVEDRLLTASGFRGTVPLEEATHEGIADEDIATLVDRRLVRAEERLGIPHLELTHDLLTAVVQKSRDERQEREQREREARRIEREEQERAEQEHRRQMELRRARRLLAVMAGATGIFLLLGLISFRSYQKARVAERQATDVKNQLVQTNKFLQEAIDTAQKAADTATEQQGIATDARGNAERAAATERAVRAADLAAQPGREMDALAVAVKAMAQTLEHPGTRPMPALIEGLSAAVDAAKLSIPLQASATAAAFSRDSKRLLTSSGDEVILWDTSDGRRIATIPQLDIGTAEISAMSFSCDDREVVTMRNARNSYGAQIWDARTGAPRRILSGHGSYVYSAFFSPDSTRVVTASADGTARIWDARSGSTIAELKTGPGEVRGSVLLAVFSADGSRILTTHEDALRVWDGTTGALLESTSGRRPFPSIAFASEGERHWLGAHAIAAPSPESPCGVRSDHVSPDGKLLVHSNGRKPVFRDASSNQDVNPAYGGFGEDADAHTAQVDYVSFSPDGQFVVSADSDATARVWNARTGQLFCVLRGQRANRRTPFAGFAPDNRTVVTTGIAPRLWNTRVDRSLRTLGQQIVDLNGRDNTHVINAAAFSPDGATAITSHLDGFVRLWDVATGALHSSVQVTRGLADGIVRGAAFSPHGGRFIAIATKTQGPEVALFDARTRRRLGVFEGAAAEFGSSTRDDVLVIASKKGWVLVDADTARVLRQGGSGAPDRAALSPDSHLIAIVHGSGNDVSLADLRDGKEVHLVHNGSQYNYAAFSPDSLQVITPSADGYHAPGPIVGVDAHDTRTGKVIATFRGHTGWVSSASYSPDGARLVTASEDRTARIWDVASATVSATLEHAEVVKEAAFSPEGSQVLTVTDKQVFLWDASSGRRLATLLGHSAEITSVAFSRDGRRIITGSRDGSAKIYSAVVPELLTEYLTAAFRFLRQQPRQYEEVRALEPLLAPYLRALH